MKPVPSEDPLNKRYVTEGSTDVLPAYPVAFITVGLILLLQGGARTSNGAFHPARWTLQWTSDPIRAWAVIFLAIGVVEGWAWHKENRRLFRRAMLAGVAVVTFWATLLLLSAFTDPLVSFTGAAWLYFVAWCHKASLKSLSRDKVFKS